GAGRVRRGAVLARGRAGVPTRAGRDAGAGGGSDRRHREGAAGGRGDGMRAALRVLAVAAAVLVVGQGRARADRVEEAWRRGNEAYLHGDYAGAVAAYQEVDRQGLASSDVAFNLGDAYFRKGAIGPAIWAFERALAFDPNDDDARYNLEQARKLAARRAH